MRLGLISVGFLMLHLDFLPTSISLTIIILGLIYVYQDHKSNESLYLILTNILLIILSFISIPLLFITAKIIYVIFLLLFIEKSIVDERDKQKFHKSIIAYAVSLFLSIVPIGPITLLSILVAFIISIYIYFQLSHLRKMTIVEDRPQIVSTPMPKGISIFVVVISIVIIVLTRQNFVEYNYDKANNIEVYEIISDKQDIKIQYITNQQIFYRIMNSYRGGGFPCLWLDDTISGETLVVEVNGNEIINNNIAYDGTKWNLTQTGLNYNNNSNIDQQDCIIKVDEKEYNGVIQRVKPTEYRYEDNEIKLDHCYIEAGYVISMPRIQVNGKGRYIRTVSILDKDNNEIGTWQYDSSEYSASDNKTVYLEVLADTENIGNSPYKVKIGFEYQDNDIDKVEFKEYNLVKQ